MSTIFSGSIHINKSTNDHFQFIYGSNYDDNFLGLYGKFVVAGMDLTEVELRVINYSNIKAYSIASAKFSDSFNPRNCREISLSGSGIPINCLTLEVDIVSGIGLGHTSSRNLNQATYPIKNIKNIQINENLYLEVLRLKDNYEDSHESSERDIQLSSCKSVPKSNSEIEIDSPGLICPRGYSKIFI